MQARATLEVSIPEDFKALRSPKVLQSPFAEKVRRFKRELTAQLFLRRGSFWDAVSKMRQRWNIVPEERVPDLPKISLFPRQLPEDRYGEWLGDLASIEREVVPEGMRRRTGHWWSRFLSACVLYDPPELELLAFAAYGDPQPVPLPPIRSGKAEPLPTPEDILERVSTLVAEQVAKRFPEQLGYRTQPAEPSGSKRNYWTDVAMSVPPVVKLRDPYEVEEVAMWFWTQSMRGVVERYIRPQGLDVETVLHDVLDSSGLWEEYRDRMEQVSETYYILVDEYTTEEDLESARRIIRATQNQDSGGRPARDPLVALQCALLHDKYNETEPTDKRFWRWTYPRLAEEFKQFGVRNARSAEEHTKLGRQLLKNRLT
jgi:hypothetical protein